MEYRRLGSTGLKVSRLMLGCGNFGGIGSAAAFYGMGETEAQAVALMDRAHDAGINVFDTADAYGGGRSEAFIGRWLKAKGTRVRDHLVLSSKVFNPVGPGPNDRGLSRGHILRQIDASLTRLQTDRLDMGLVALADDARARGVDVAALALAWVLHHPQMDAAVIGPRRPAHVETALAAIDITLTDDEAGRLGDLFA
jgi:aryl-alcohol dehydrogenase-like predicted oxidoreductase